MRRKSCLRIALWGCLFFFTTVGFCQHSVNAVTVLVTSPVQYEKTEFDIAITGAFTNPYNASDIAVDMVLTSPSSKTVKLPCYYVSGNATGSMWKARFAARESGIYSFRVDVTSSGTTDASSGSDAFTVIASTGKGFLHKNNKWSFKFDNGEPFRGVGENFGWEPRQNEQNGYKGAYTYRYLLPKLANNGVTFFRTWMCPWNLPLEWKKVVNTTRYFDSSDYFNPGAIAKMDSLMMQCDTLGLHMMLTLDYHGALCFNWDLSNYNTANGGPIAQPAAFFTDASARAMYKNRLRYIVARWGYSPAIGAFELFNEVDNAMYSESNGGLPRIPDADVTTWHDEMSTYLKSIDPYEHLVTTSISYRDVYGMNALPNIDFNQKHIYEDPYVGQIDQSIVNGAAANGKPYVIGEYSYRYQDDNYNSAYAASYDLDFKQGLWLGLFSPTPIVPMSWWWEMFDSKSNITKYFRAVRAINDSIMRDAGPSLDLAAVTATASADGQKVLAVRAGANYYAYINNTTKNPVTTNLTISIGKKHNYDVQVYDPANGDNATYTSKGAFAANSSITIPGVTLEGQRERIVILSPTDNLVTAVEGNDVSVSAVYPNPCHGSFSVHVAPTVTAISVVNALGVAVFEKEDIQRQDVVIDKNFTAGLYFIFIRHSTGESEVLKEIVNH